MVAYVASQKAVANRRVCIFVLVLASLAGLTVLLSPNRSSSPSSSTLARNGRTVSTGGDTGASGAQGAGPQRRGGEGGGGGGRRGGGQVIAQGAVVASSGHKDLKVRSRSNYPSSPRLSHIKSVVSHGGGGGGVDSVDGGTSSNKGKQNAPHQKGKGIAGGSSMGGRVAGGRSDRKWPPSPIAKQKKGSSQQLIDNKKYKQVAQSNNAVRAVRVQVPLLEQTLPAAALRAHLPETFSDAINSVFYIQARGVLQPPPPQNRQQHQQSVQFQRQQGQQREHMPSLVLGGGGNGGGGNQQLQKNRRPTVLLLHGAAFTSRVWRERTNTIDTIARAGYDVIAVDLPGHGKSRGRVRVGNRGSYLRALMTALGLQKPVILAPSMSGSFALPLLLMSEQQQHQQWRRQQQPTEATAEAPLLSGFVAVAPIGVGMYSRRQWAGVRLPLLAIIGERDVTHLKDKAIFDLVKDSVYLEIKGGTHPCYLDAPAIFNRQVVNFLHSLPGRRIAF